MLSLFRRHANFPLLSSLSFSFLPSHFLILSSSHHNVLSSLTVGHRCNSASIFHCQSSRLCPLRTLFFPVTVRDQTLSDAKMPPAGFQFPDRAAATMAKRLEKLKRVEEAKPPEDRIVNRDWDDEVQKKIGMLEAIRQRNAKRHFIELATSELVNICKTVEEAEAFFTKDGTKFTCKTLKMFTEAHALSSNGQITDVPTVRTIQALLFALYSACKNSNNPVDRDVKRSTMMWVQSDLAVRGLACYNQRRKEVAMPEDFSAFIRAFFDTEYLTATQYSTRNALNFVLCANMMLDCSNRISELLRPSLSNADWEVYKKERKDRLFTWGRVELFAYPGVDSPVDLRARLTFRGLKNTGQKGNKSKIIPIRLLPLHMAAEDSLRWLLILGLIDRVFEGISRWSDFDAVRPSQHGTVIHIKKSMLEVPVFRQPVYKPADPSLDLLEADVMRSQNFVKQLKVLSRHCGLQSPMLPGVLRRGSAYLLGLKTSHEERCARMGHDDKDTTYWGAYRNQTSTVDFQALRHNLDAVDVSRMSSIFRGRSESAPTCVSEQGMIEISRDQELIRLLERECEVIDRAVQAFGSLAEARAQGSPTASEHAAIRRQYQERERTLMTKKFEEEYRQHFENPNDAPEMTTHVEPRDQGAYYDNMLDVDDAENALIDPALLQDVDSMAADLGNMLVDDDSQPDDTEMEDMGSNLGTETDASSLHTSGTTGRSKFSLRVVAKNSVFEGLFDIIFNQPEDLSAAQFADVCVEKFNHLHAADKYYPDQEPTPGTLSCRFCGICLIGIDHNGHIRTCGLTSMAKHILEDLDRHQETHPPAQKCGMVIGSDSVRLCAAKYKQKRNANSGAHFTEHCYKRHRDASTGQYICNDDATTFSSWEDFRIHRVVHHAASTTVIPVDEKSGNPRAEILLFWCKICQYAYSRTEVDEDSHFVQHLDDVQLALDRHGFSGYFFTFRWFHPSFCIFCLYDGNAGFSTQFADFYTEIAFTQHVEKHFRDLNDDVSISCPASASTANGIKAVCHRSELMSKDALVTHLIEDHNLAINSSKTCFKNVRKRSRPALAEKNVNEGIPGASADRSMD
ncbi:hypothetical protein ONS95_011183 [Cadophora gregata]|uniref:uncharacterized protein n=1 Tax=Cadophora gregata TaxID=51156 RepID=UPI0026DDABB7|nr:uncharacterized protein ONS95_011183 [Cadophora gregata]KAK0119748.1 hypothetical protein ONS95_011183 [Cadophora gregata]KAK0120783.1 hypothetical protein ONS96_010985 [Cadophora gregata f. sp. sojae]